MTDPTGVPIAPPLDLDPVIHAQARLRVMATLAMLTTDDRIAFSRLQKLLDMTAGNLSTHFRKLEDAGYIDVTKAHSGRQPVTWIALSPAGRQAFDHYTAALQQLLDVTGTTFHSSDGTGAR